MGNGTGNPLEPGLGWPDAEWAARMTNRALNRDDDDRVRIPVGRPPDVPASLRNPDKRRKEPK